MVILVTGAHGQLGQALQSIAPQYSGFQLVFCSSKELDITNKENCETVFAQYKPDICINAAAYTAVDKAESEPEKAELINVEGVKNIAEVCKAHNTVLIHISTDFVFDGKAEPYEKINGYNEEKKPNPTGVYGLTKWQGEQAVEAVWEKHIIVRTSWVYSEFGNNFMKTMLRLAQERDSLSVVNDQTGTPTYAVDLADTLLKIISKNDVLQSVVVDNKQSKIFNYSNIGQCTWYDFAKEIFAQKNITINLSAIPTTAFPTPAKRPSFSVLDKEKIKNTFKIEIPEWKESLKTALSR